jgi:flagellar L-ring protein FlgH
MKCALLFVMVSLAAFPAGSKPKKAPGPTPLDRYVEEAMTRGPATSGPAASGSIWSPAARFGDLANDIRAARVDDIVTILVAERASAVSKGASKSARSSSVKAGVDAMGGVTRATGPWPNLAKVSGEHQLDGQGETSRETSLSTTVAARVTHILPNGYLVVEGNKAVTVNSEAQIITVRGVVRPTDLSTGNVVQSDQLGQLEVRVDGKGLVGDAIRRPFILYRILLGILPF